MTSILDGELAAEVADALSNAAIPIDLTVTRMLPGSTDPPFAPWDPGPPTPDPHTCKGWPDVYMADELANSLILSTDVKVFVVATTLDIDPTPADTVTVRGVTYQVISVSADPALAIWTLQARS